MPPRPRTPAALVDRPFSTQQAAELGLTRRMLVGASYRRLFPRVWVHVGHEMSHADWIAAAQLTMPTDARVTGLTRLQELGVDHGPPFPLHFVVARDHHIATEGIMLHRTERMPPNDGAAVSPAAAFVAYCVEAVVIDAIIVGDWLLREGHMSVAELVELAQRDDWRAGAGQALWIAEHLEPDSWSPSESRTRAALVFAGLPKPASNTEIKVDGRLVAIGDLTYLEYQTVVEYEGLHHQTDRRQYLRDIEKYRTYRDLELRYVQVTREMARNLISVVRVVHAAIVEGGYRGPDPRFGRRWRTLFGRIPVAPSRPRLAVSLLRDDRAGGGPVTDQRAG